MWLIASIKAATLSTHWAQARKCKTCTIEADGLGQLYAVTMMLYCLDYSPVASRMHICGTARLRTCCRLALALAFCSLHPSVWQLPAGGDLPVSHRVALLCSQQSTPHGHDRAGHAFIDSRAVSTYYRPWCQATCAAIQGYDAACVGRVFVCLLLTYVRTEALLTHAALSLASLVAVYGKAAVDCMPPSCTCHRQCRQANVRLLAKCEFACMTCVLMDSFN